MARRAARLDVPGAVLAILAVAAVVWAFNEGLSRPAAWLGLLVAAVSGRAFALVERRTADPMVPPAVWRLPLFRRGATVAAVLTATTSGANVIGTAQGTAEAPRKRSAIGGLLTAAARIGTAIGIAVLLAVSGGRAMAYLAAAAVTVVATAACALPQQRSTLASS